MSDRSLDKDVHGYWTWIRASGSESRADRIRSEHQMPEEHAAWWRVSEVIDSGTSRAALMLVLVARSAASEDERRYLLAGPFEDFLEAGGSRDQLTSLAAASQLPWLIEALSAN
ncbi:hypothetical protein [Aeromicrobium panaciterrae]|uniref:hypothetical protein n=1 Tax=Aeromicrobium panaciterrae TaxID=363861 RepID=UPI0031DE7540